MKNRQIEAIKAMPDNEWAVYELCKNIKEKLIGLSSLEKYNLLKNKVPFATRRALMEGIAEFEAVPAHNLPRRAKKSTGTV